MGHLRNSKQQGSCKREPSHASQRAILAYLLPSPHFSPQRDMVLPPPSKPTLLSLCAESQRAVYSSTPHTPTVRVKNPAISLMPPIVCISPGIRHFSPKAVKRVIRPEPMGQEWPQISSRERAAITRQGFPFDAARSSEAAAECWRGGLFSKALPKSEAINPSEAHDR